MSAAYDNAIPRRPPPLSAGSACFSFLDTNAGEDLQPPCQIASSTAKSVAAVRQADGNSGGFHLWTRSSVYVLMDPTVLCVASCVKQQHKLQRVSQIATLPKADANALSSCGP
jgi:hypothetical protein